MIDAIVYSSLSGSCEEYAQRMSAALHIPFFTEKSGLCPVGRKIAYIGWLFAGKVVGLDKAMDRYDVCCVVSVGMGDPAVNPDAKKYDQLSYMDVLNQGLGVMDSTATSLSMDNHIPILVFALSDPENIHRAVNGEKIGTIVEEVK